MEHDIAGLEVAIKKVILFGGQQEESQAFEIVLQRLFVERNARQSQEVVFEIVEIPCNRLPVKTVARIANPIIEILGGFDLKTGQDGDNLPVSIDDLRMDHISRPIS